MPFDPDEYLRQTTPSQTTESTTGFSPDAYLKSSPTTDSGFNPIPQVMGLAHGVVAPLAGGAATENARNAIGIAKNATQWTPNALAEVVSNPLNTLKAYVAQHPFANTPIKQIAGGIGKNVLGAAATGLAGTVLSPESAFSAPYQMSAYEQEKIRANPTAPQYQTNPYAQQYRGEFPSQGAAGVANARNALINQPYGGLNPEQQQMLQQDRQRQLDIQKQQQKKQQAQVILQQPPTAQNFIERMTAMSDLYGDVNQG